MLVIVQLCSFPSAATISPPPPPYLSQTAVGFGVGGAAALVLFRGGMGRAAIMGFGGGWGAGSIWAQASKEFEALEKKLPTK